MESPIYKDLGKKNRFFLPKFTKALKVYDVTERENAVDVVVFPVINSSSCISSC